MLSPSFRETKRALAWAGRLIARSLARQGQEDAFKAWSLDIEATDASPELIEEGFNVIVGYVGNQYVLGTWCGAVAILRQNFSLGAAVSRADAQVFLTDRVLELVGSAHSENLAVVDHATRSHRSTSSM